MRVAIIGGTGHIGSYLTPRLFAAGHTVVCVCRGLKAPYQKSAAWRAIKFAEMDRAAEEASGNFGERVAALEPDAVIDLTCYKLESAQQLVASVGSGVLHEHYDAPDTGYEVHRTTHSFYHLPWHYPVS